jgi:hypothetical protein
LAVELVAFQTLQNALVLAKLVKASTPAAVASVGATFGSLG